MSKWNLLSTRVIILSLVVLLAMGSVASAGDALLELLPGDCMFCVRVNNFDATLNKVDAYTFGVTPMPMNVAMMVKMQLAAIVGDQELTGIEMNGDVAFVGITEKLMGLLVPVSNYKEFIKTNPNCSIGENGVVILKAGNPQMGGFAMMEAAGGKYALVVPQEEQDSLPAIQSALKNKAMAISKRISAAEAEIASSRPAWAFVNVGSLYEKHHETILQKMEQMQSEMPKMSGMENMGMVFKMYGEIFKSVGGDVDYLALGLSPEATKLSLDVTLKAKKGTDLAAMFQADPEAANATYNLAGYSNNGNAFNGLFKMHQGSLEKMYDKMFAVMSSSFTDDNLQESTGKLQALTMKMLPALGDEVFVSLGFSKGMPPFKLVEVVELKDAKSIKELMSESFQYTGLFYEAMGMPMELEYTDAACSYKDMTMDQVKLVFDMPANPNDPSAQIVKQMYGDAFVYHLTYTDDKMLLAMGSDSESMLKSLVDAPAGSVATGDIKIAMDLLQGTEYDDMMCSLNMIKYLQGVGDFMGSTTQGMDPAMAMMMPFGGMFEAFDVPSQSTMAIGGKIGDGEVGVRAILPKEHLSELFAGFMKMQQQMMQQQMQMQQGQHQQDGALVPN